jgi:hypothetical protein
MRLLLKTLNQDRVRECKIIDSALYLEIDAVLSD